MKRLTVAMLSFAVAGPAVFAHSRFLNNGKLALRNGNDANKTGPCGSDARNPNPTVFTSGQTITVEWEETIQHPGKFQISFSAGNDANFQLLQTINDTKDDANVPHRNSATITLPQGTCEACTLQLIQVMTENPAAPRNYYSCADIKLIAPTSGSPVATLPVSTAGPTVSPLMTPAANDAAKCQ